MTTDFLVIGSGMAGLTYAIKIAEQLPDKKIVVLAKNKAIESNTQYAQGGVAIVQNETDSFEKHIADTLKAGDGLCNEKVVRLVISEGPFCLHDMINWGVDFDVNNKGEYDLGKEAGHSENRVVHHKDITGAEIIRALNEQLESLKNVKFLTHHFAIDLISNHHLEKPSSKNSSDCYGAYVLNEKENNIITLLSKITLLATGGIGQIYGHTTNPEIATGDGMAMAYRIKAKIKEIEFVQFHPTALYNPEETPAFLISEAVRGLGAKLKTRDGEEFMYKYDQRGALASRDIVARAIDSELKNRGDNYVYLDCTHLKREKFMLHFPNIAEKCSSIGIDVHKDFIPVTPAAHYACGGITVNQDGESSIPNLFACGECSQTGLHGANRLASNSLLEAFVYATKAASKSAQLIEGIAHPIGILDWKSKGTTLPKELVLISHNRKELQGIMNDYVGIVRSKERLDRAEKRLHLLYKETETLYQKTIISPQLCELRNMITIAYLVVSFSQKRTENCGGFYNIDLA